MFQFPAFASILNGYRSFKPVGCPIRKSRDQWSFAPTPGLSQLITSFIACESLGIRHTPFSTFARTELVIKRARLIYFQLFLLYHIIHLSIYDAEIRFTFCFRFQYVKDHFGPESGSGNPRAWTSVPGRFPSFLLYILFTETRELQHLRKHFFANLAVPLTCVVLSYEVFF